MFILDLDDLSRIIISTVLFSQKKFSLISSQKYGFWLCDLEKTFIGSWIQGSKRHRIPDSDPQHWKSDADWHVMLTTVKISVADPGSGVFLTPGSGMGKKSRSGTGIQYEHPGTYIRELRNNFGRKILKFFDADPDSGSGIFLTLVPGSGMEKFGSGITSRIRDIV